MGNYFANEALDADDSPRECWTPDDEDRLLRQMGYADTVAIGTLRVVTRYTPSVDRAGQLTMAFRPDEILFGSLSDRLDDEGQLQLHTGPDAPGSQPGARYLLFLKQAKGKDLRWASYRVSPRLLDEVRRRYAWLRRHRGGSGG